MGEPEDRVLLEVRVVLFGVVDIIVEAAGFLPLPRGPDDELGDGSDVPELYEVIGDLEVPVVVVYLVL